MATIQEMIDERGRLLAEARKINDTAKAAGAVMSAEDSAKFDELFSKADDLKKQADQMAAAERLAREEAVQREQRIAAATAEMDHPRERQTQASQPHGGSNDAKTLTIVIHGQKLTFEQTSKTYQRCVGKGRDAWQGYLRSGDGKEFYSDLQTDVDTSGGYLVAPEEMLAELLKTVDDETFIRRLARKFSTRAQALSVRSRQTKLVTANWGSELTNPSRDTSLKFGKRILTPHYITQECRISRDLLAAAEMNPETIVMDEMARDTSELEEIGFISGSGAGQPLGLFTASSDGIPTSRDVSTDNAATMVTVDGLKNAKFSLKDRYRRRSVWMFHRDGIKQISKLKDGNGQYLWQDAVVAGDPDRLLGMPVYESEWIPNTFTTGQYVGLLGDMSYYWIVDGLDLGVQRLNEVYAADNMVGFITRRKVDGMPMLAEAFARVKLG